MSTPMTAQEVFDKVALHLLTQGKRAYDDEQGICRYRMPDGLKCAVGCIIPDEEYLSDMEGRDVNALVAEGYMVELFEPHLLLLKDLQFAHDCTMPGPSAWPRRLIEIAQRYNLDYSIVATRRGEQV